MGGEEGNTGSLPDGKPSKVKWLLRNFRNNGVIYQFLKELNIHSGRIGVVSLYSLDQVDRILNPYHPWLSYGYNSRMKPKAKLIECQCGIIFALLDFIHSRKRGYCSYKCRKTFVLAKKKLRK